MTEKLGALLAMWIGAIIGTLHPWAVAGAAFGCCFFLASPSAATGWRRLFLGLFSLGMGYGAGIYWYGGGPPYDGRAMLVAGFFAALIVVFCMALYHMIDKGKKLPPWLDRLLDFAPFSRRKGGDNGN